MGNMPLPVTEKQDTAIGNVFTGMGTIASFAAIENIIVVEHAFGETFLSAFSPARKFWSAKVLVSLSFMQKIVLSCPPFLYWSETKQNLLFSSVICFECFLIAIFHMLAWQHQESWYKELVVNE